MEAVQFSHQHIYTHGRPSIVPAHVTAYGRRAPTACRLAELASRMGPPGQCECDAYVPDAGNGAAAWAAWSAGGVEARAR